MQCGEARKHLYCADQPSSNAVISIKPVEVVEAEAHLAHCAACQEFLAAEKRLNAFLRGRKLQEKASASLREQIFNRIAQERAQPREVRHRFSLMLRRNLSLALVGILVITMLTADLWLSRRHGRLTPQQWASIFVQDHARNFQGAGDIRSSDPDAVQSWFRGKVDFSFRLPSAADPKLIGARLCHLQDRRAALIFYQHPQSPVSLFVLDGSGVDLPEDQVVNLDGKRRLVDAKKGYNVVLWKERGLLYSLVSDIPSLDLLQLAGKF